MGARRLLTPKWVFGHLLVVLLVFSFTNFGFWQLRRLELRETRNELIASRVEAEPIELSRLLDGAPPAEELAYRRAYTPGTFDTEEEILLRSRSRDGQPGWHVLTPLLREEGDAVLVDRGWVPQGFDEPPVTEAAPPIGEVVVSGLVRLEQDPPDGWAAALAPRDPPEGEVDRAYWVDIDRLAPQLPYPVLPVYLELTDLERLSPAGAGQAAQPGAQQLPLRPEPPELESGPHLSYALQWFSFAVIGVVGYAILLRRTIKEE